MQHSVTPDFAPFEEKMRRALSISQGDASVFFTHPLSAALLALAAVALVGPIVWRLRRRTAQES